MSQAQTTVRVVALDETGSTNTEAIALVQAGAQPLPFWVTAKQQTAGRGRDGRAWISMSGNVHASLAVALDCEMRVAPQLALVAGVGVSEAVRALAVGHDVPHIQTLTLKWPNDILIGGAKCGGILVQTTVEPGSERLVAVIGIGINVVSHPKVDDRVVTDLLAEGFGASRDEVFHRVAAAMDAALLVWDFGRGFPQIRTRWLDAGMRIGTALSVHAGGAVKAGVFAGLDDDGALLMRDGRGVCQRITFGDVVL